MPSPSSYSRYVISNLKGWLVKLAPILHISLCVLKVALTAAELMASPSPSLISLGRLALSPFEASLRFLDDTASVLSEYLEEKANEAAQDAIGDIDESLSALAQANPSDAAAVIRRHSRRLAPGQEAGNPCGGRSSVDRLLCSLFSLEKGNGETYAQDWLPNQTRPDQTRPA
jgi:hypothetical protein